MEELKTLFNKLESAEAETNYLDSLMEENPEDEELEKQWDIAYKNEYEINTELINYIVSLTNGKIDLRTANLMLRNKRNQLRNLILKIS